MSEKIELIDINDIAKIVVLILNKRLKLSYLENLRNKLLIVANPPIRVRQRELSEFYSLSKLKIHHGGDYKNNLEESNFQIRARLSKTISYINTELEFLSNQNIIEKSASNQIDGDYASPIKKFDLTKFENINLRLSKKNKAAEIKDKLDLLNKNKSYLNDLLFLGRFDLEITGRENGKPVKLNGTAPLEDSEIEKIKKILNYYETKLVHFSKLLEQSKKSPKIPIEHNLSKASSRKFIWKKDKKDLVFLIDELIRLQFLAQSNNVNKLICDHFITDSSTLKPSELSDLKSKLKKSTYPLNPSLEIKETIEKLHKRNK